MKEFRKHILALLLFIFCSPSFAYTLKEGNVTALVGPYFYKANFQSTDTGAQSPILGDVGLVIQGDISDHSGLEISLFHMHKLYFREEGANSIVEETQLIHTAMGYRYWFNPYLSLALSFYSAYSMADPKIIHSDFAPGAEIDTSARDTTEYGFDASIQSELWNDGGSTAVIADARYSHSVTNKKNEKGDDYGLFIAVKFLVQEKHSEKK